MSNRILVNNLYRIQDTYYYIIDNRVYDGTSLRLEDIEVNDIISSTSPISFYVYPNGSKLIALTLASPYRDALMLYQELNGRLVELTDRPERHQSIRTVSILKVPLPNGHPRLGIFPELSFPELSLPNINPVLLEQLNNLITRGFPQGITEAVLDSILLANNPPRLPMIIPSYSLVNTHQAIGRINRSEQPPVIVDIVDQPQRTETFPPAPSDTAILYYDPINLDNSVYQIGNDFIEFDTGRVVRRQINRNSLIEVARITPEDRFTSQPVFVITENGWIVLTTRRGQVEPKYWSPSNLRVVLETTISRVSRFGVPNLREINRLLLVQPLLSLPAFDREVYSAINELVENDAPLNELDSRFTEMLPSTESPRVEEVGTEPPIEDYLGLQNSYETLLSLLYNLPITNTIGLTSFNQVTEMLSNEQIQRFELDPILQPYAGLNSDNRIVTLYDRFNDKYYVKARYDAATRKIYPPV